MEDQRRMEVKVASSPGRISQVLVYEGTDIPVGHAVYGLHERLAAVGYRVKCQMHAISVFASVGHPMYGIVREVSGKGVVVEETQTGSGAPAEGRRVQFERQFFLDNYEVD
jgi:hypothetical protein